MKGLSRVIVAIILVGLFSNVCYAAEGSVSGYEVESDEETVARAGGCGSWGIYKTDSSYCDSKDGCGAFWAKDTNKQKAYYQRNCVNSTGAKYTEYDTNVIVLGCCD